MYAMSLTCGEDTLALYGAPLRQARLAPPAASGPDEVQQALELSFEDGPAAAQAWMERAGRLLAGERPQLAVQPEAGGPIYHTPLYAWRWEALDGMGAALRGGARLALRRADWWQGPETALALSNPHGQAQDGGLTVYNHGDAGHANHAHIAGAGLAGDLPAACRVEIENPLAGQVFTHLYLALDAHPGAETFAPTLEGEQCTLAAGGAAPTLDAACSGGAWQRASWSGAGETVVLGWELSGAQSAHCAGRVLRPLARFAAPPGPGSLWLRWLLSAGAALEYSPRALLTGGQALQALPPLYLPAGQSGALQLYLLAQPTTDGSYQLDVDFVQLLPTDGWRQYCPAPDLGLGHQQTLVDDGAQERLYARSAAGNLAGYTALGPGVRLKPGVDQRLYWLCAGSGGSAPAGQQARLRVSYRPRWRQIVE